MFPTVPGPGSVKNPVPCPLRELNWLPIVGSRPIEGSTPSGNCAMSAEMWLKSA